MQLSESTKNLRDVSMHTVRLLGVFIILCVSGSSRVSQGADLYVSPSGSDSSSGTARRPFATFERAQQEVRVMQKGGRLKSGINVWIEGGDYCRTNTLTLTAEDSGRPGAPVTWRSKGKLPARLLGGIRVPEFQPVTSPVLLQRLPEEARAHARQASLAALGSNGIASFSSRGFARPTSPAHNELFYGHKPMIVARWPNEGQFSNIAGFPQAASKDDSHGGSIGKLEEGFHYSGDRPATWKEPERAWVHGYWAWDWANSYERIDSLDSTRKLIKLAPPAGNYGFRKDQRIYFVNVLEELDQPSEYYIDAASATLIFWPPEPGPADKGGKIDALVSVLSEPLVRMAGASNLVLRGLVFEASRGSAIHIRDGASNTVASCLIRNMGTWAVRVEGGSGHKVVACDILDTGDGGVSLSGGDRKTLTPSGHVVENCRFARQGRWSKCYVPAVRMDGVGQMAIHNLISEHPHCAILFEGNEHRMEFNEITRIALETGDVGAIYTGRNFTWRGNRVRHNYIHHTGGVGLGSMGVYMDDCVSGTEIFGNLFFKVQRAVFLGGGRDHLVSNNIFVDCNHAVELDGRGLNQSPVWRSMVNDFMRDGLREVPLDLYRKRYPLMKTLDAYYGPPGGPEISRDQFSGIPPEGNEISRNICVGKWLNIYWHAAPERVLITNNVAGPDPRFVAPIPEQPAPRDFALKPDSPAWALGFEAIPFDRIGLQQDDRRGEIPR